MIIGDNISKCINDYNALLDKENSGVCLSNDEMDRLNHFDFEFAKSIVTDLDKVWSLQITKHILAHYEY